VYACIEEIVRVITKVIGACPLLLPTSHDRETVESLLDHVDGILLPGSISNIHPRHYGEEPSDHPQVFDEDHDATDIFLIQQAKERGIPFLGICRGMQAMNLAFGGTLNQKIRDETIDHKCSYPCNGAVDEPQYMHEVKFTPQGYLAQLLGAQAQKVNSMHEQAISVVSPDLTVEAVADDGIIEAVSYPEVKRFFLGVQWHPETMPNHPVSKKIFAAYRASVEERFHTR
jgi:putative glutamine amidotransferase